MREPALQPKIIGPEDYLRFLRALVIAFVGIRLVYAAALQLVPDEATYWVWSRHLAAGYLDHPPAIAFLIRAGTYLLGSTELGVRLSTVLMAAGTMLITVALARHVLRDARAAVWVAVIWLTSPLLAGLGTLTTPDTPALFFSVCALSFAVLIADRDDGTNATQPSNVRLWLLFGISVGLALLSKYPAVLLPTSIAMAMLFSRKGRQHYRRPWIYLAGILALVLFSPVIRWNATHQWASFSFQLHHGADAGEDAPMPTSPVGRFIQFGKDVGLYIGGQTGVFTPLLFAIAAVVLVLYWRRYREIGQVDRVLLWAGTLPLAFFGIMFLKSHHGEVNWPAFAYFPISILMARWLSEKWDGERVKWARGGIHVAIGVLIVMHVITWPAVTARLLRLPIHIPHALKDLVGWREYGRALASQTSLTDAPLVANRHQDAAEAAFYVPTQPEVWCIGVGFRPTCYDYFDDPPDFTKIPAVIWIGGHRDLFARKYGYVEQARTDLTFLAGKNERAFTTAFLVRPQR